MLPPAHIISKDLSARCQCLNIGFKNTRSVKCECVLRVLHRVVALCGDGDVTVLCEPFPWDTRRLLREATQKAEWGLGEGLGFVPQLRGWASSATESVSGTVGTGCRETGPDVRFAKISCETSSLAKVRTLLD